MNKFTNTNCSVRGCKSLKRNDPHIHFHHYPHENKGSVDIVNNLGVAETMDRRKAWMLRLKMDKPVGRSMLVCSKHFKPEDYFASSSTKTHPRLKSTAVPSLNLPKCYRISAVSQETRVTVRQARLEELRNKNLSATEASKENIPSNTEDEVVAAESKDGAVKTIEFEGCREENHDH